MFKTDLNGRTWHTYILNLCLFLFVYTSGAEVYASHDEAPSDAITCNDKVNVSLDESTCNAIITADMIVEGTMNDLFTYTVTVAGPLPSTAVVANNEILEKGDYTVTVTQTEPDGSVNWCWGNLLAEDKTSPEITDTDITDDANDTVCPCEDEAAPCELSMLCTHLDEMLTVFVDSDLPELYATYGIPVPAAFDQCDKDDVSISFYDDPDYVSAGNNGDVCATKVIKRTWIFKDKCGNKTESCDYFYSIIPLTVDDNLPVTEPYEKVFLPCHLTEWLPADIYNHYYNFFYDYKINYYIENHPDYPHATIADLTAAQITNAETEANTQAIPYAYPVLFGQNLDEGLYCNLAVVYEDDYIDVCGNSCPNSNKVIRTWSIYNWCVGGEQIEFVQIIDATDQEGPEVDTKDFTVSVDPWGCFGDFDMPAPTHLHDACSDFVGYYVTGPVGAEIELTDDGVWHVTNAPKGSYPYLYHGYDCCDNETIDTAWVAVVDNTQPIAVAKQDIVVSLINVDQTTDGGTGIAKLYAESINNGSYDGCGPVHLEVRREADYCSRVGNTTYNDDSHPYDDIDDTDGGAFVSFCCTDIADNGIDEDQDGINDYAILKVWLRVWDDGDMDGVYGSAGDNYNEAWGYVRLEDKAQPDILCPKDITISCAVDSKDWDIVGSGQALNACGSATPLYEDDVDVDGCGAGVIKRKWYIDGNPGINCVQTITVEPSDNGDIQIWWPEDKTTDCTDDLINDVPTWSTSNPCDLLAWSVDVDTFYFEPGACYKIVKYWTVVNWCGYDDLHNYFSDYNTQIIKVVDNTDPIFLECQDSLMFEANDYDDEDGDGIVCENNMVMLTSTADDEGDCASPWLKWDIEVDLDGDGWVEYVYSSDLPSNDPFYFPPSLTGSQVKITLPEGVRGSMSTHKVKWTVSDGCGNGSVCHTTFMVVDKKPPTPYCVNLSTALMENGQVELWACDFDLGSFDNCTPHSQLRFTFSATPPSEDPLYNEDSKCSNRVFTCDDFLNSPVQVEMYVWDEKDNYDFCIVTLTLIDNNNNCTGGGSRADIAGKVIDERGESIEDVMIELISALPSPNNDMTDFDGEFRFDDLSMYVDYKLQGIKNTDYLNGVSTLDLVMIQRHILGIDFLDSAYKLIAGDINNDEKLSSIDLIELRKLILGLYTELPSNDSWRFVAQPQSLNQTSPWPFIESININDLDQHELDQTFVGVKVGDVNHTAALRSLTGSEVDSRSDDNLVFSIENKLIADGSIVEMDITADNFEDVFGYQFTMDLNGLSLVDQRSGSLDVSNDNIAVFDNQLTMSWHNMDAVSSDEVLFTLVFESNTSGKLLDKLNINSTLTTAEAYIGESLEIVGVELRGDEATEVFSLYQNIPNPFSTNTTIAFELPEAGSATLRIYDVTGKNINVITGNYDKGYNQIELNVSQLNQSGILYYELESGNHIATKKMVVLK